MAHITDEQRKDIEKDLEAALLLLHHAQVTKTVAHLRPAASTPFTDSGNTEEGQAKIVTDVQNAYAPWILSFAAQRALLIQQGTNAVIDKTQQIAPGDDAAMRAAAESTGQYNADTLAPFLGRWARQQGLLNTYRYLGADKSGLWVWTQTLTWEDECQEADSASPSPLDELLAITGMPPPVHPRCGCLLTSVDWPDALQD